MAGRWPGQRGAKQWADEAKVGLGRELPFLPTCKFSLA